MPNAMFKIFGAQRAEAHVEEELVSLVGGKRQARSSADRPSSSTTVHLTLSVKGMHCSSCSSAVENALKYDNTYFTYALLQSAGKVI